MCSFKGGISVAFSKMSFSTLSCCKNLPLLIKKTLTPLKLVPKNRVNHSFQNCFDISCQHCMVWSLGEVCVQKWHTNYFFLCLVGFKTSTLTVYCLSSWFVHQKRKTYSNLCVLCWLSHPSWFPGPKYIPPSFWPRVTNHDFKSQMSKKYFLGNCFVTQLLHDVEKLRKKHKTFVEVIQRVWYVQHLGVIC